MDENFLLYTYIYHSEGFKDGFIQNKKISFEIFQKIFSHILNISESEQIDLYEYYELGYDMGVESYRINQIFKTIKAELN